MIVIHSDNSFSCTNLFQFDKKLKIIEIGKEAKTTDIIRNIKKLFNFDSNNYVTLKKGEKVTVIMPNKAYECEAFSANELTVAKELKINIKDILKKLKDGRITG